MDSSRIRWGAASAIFYFATCLGHLQFSLWLVRQRQWGGQMFSLSQYVAWIAIPSAIALVLWIIRRGIGHPRRGIWFGAWVGWLGAIWLIDRHLTFSLNELAHYPQYMLLAVLIGRTIDPGRTGAFLAIVGLTTLAGAADEWLQYLWITTSYSEYLDFNDFVVNFVAAWGGALIHYAHEVADYRPRLPRRLIAAFVSLVMVTTLGLATGRLVRTPKVPVPPGGLVTNAQGVTTLYLERKAGMYGSQAAGPRHGQYWILTPEAGLALLVFGLVVAGVFQRYLGRPLAASDAE